MKRRITKEFLEVDIGKLMVESYLGSSEGSNGGGLEEGEDPTSLP